MTIVLQVPCDDHHAKKINDAILDAAATGTVPHILIDGKPYILHAATTPGSSHSFHPTDPHQDKHQHHDHQAGVGLSYTLVEKPAD